MFSDRSCCSLLRFFSAAIFTIFFLSSMNAQNIIRPALSNNFSKEVRSGGKFKVLAVMVQFKADRDTLTSGDGTFDLSDKYKDSTVDAPPHNRQYFMSHMKFLKNYYSKVSNGKVDIEFSIPDKIYTLPDSMRKYGVPKGSDFSKLANLAVDSWKLVDKESPEINFSDYDCFFIFHAGFGKDIDLAGIYGSDPTPYDLPSITFGMNSFRKYLGSSFDGISVNGGKYKITNSAILPESEYREIKSYGVTNLVELSINGLVVSSFGSYLGLPDLFNTKDGSTAIGRFGLMDGQSIFSYNGLFPPQPSAWEKVYLGWVTPVTVTGGLNEFEIYAQRTDGVFSDSKIYKVPITDKEYFLVECRYRDPGNDGLKVKTEIRGVEKEVYIKKDTTRFNQFGTVSLVDGVVTDVDDYDWSLPGGYDYKKNKLDGGILIWHIDENKIESGLADNTINNNINHRGVDLEEADGSQDIGQQYGTLQSASGSENGTALDFWYNDISYYTKDSLLRPVYKNIFSDNSNPNSRSYYGANSNISIYDFSAQAPVMTFKVKIGNDNVTLLNNFPIKLESVGKLNLTNAALKGGNEHQLIVNPDGKLKIYDISGKSILTNSYGGVNTFAVLKDASSDKLIIGKKEIGTKIEIMDFSSGENKLFEYSAASGDDSIFIYTLKNGSGNDSRIAVLNKSKGILNKIGYSGNNFYFFKSDTINKLQPVTSITAVESSSSTDHKNYFSYSIGSIYGYRNELIKFGVSEILKNFVVGNITNPNYIDIAYLYYDSQRQTINLKCYSDTDGKLTTIPSLIQNHDDAVKIFSDVCGTCWSNVSPFVIGDVDNDKISDFVFCVYDKLFAFNKFGTMLDNFPVRFKQNAVNIKPVIADLDGDNKNEIIVVSNDGNIFAYNSKGKLINGFPISIGSKPAVTPVIFNIKDTVGLAAINSNGYLYAWKLNGKYNSQKIAWSGEYGNERMTGFQGETKDIFIAKSNEYFPKSRAYNYPNPVYGNFTKIRFYVSESSSVKITILDLSGEKVKDFSMNAIGGMDNEVEWDVRDVQSGVYLAHIEAVSGSSNSNAVIKIAVVK